MSRDFKSRVVRVEKGEKGKRKERKKGKEKKRREKEEKKDRTKLQNYNCETRICKARNEEEARKRSTNESSFHGRTLVGAMAIGS